jgi:hypothetical protein
MVPGAAHERHPSHVRAEGASPCSSALVRDGLDVDERNSMSENTTPAGGQQDDERAADSSAAGTGSESPEEGAAAESAAEDAADQNADPAGDR